MTTIESGLTEIQTAASAIGALIEIIQEKAPDGIVITLTEAIAACVIRIELAIDAMPGEAAK